MVFGTEITRLTCKNNLDPSVLCCDGDRLRAHWTANDEFYKRFTTNVVLWRNQHLLKVFLISMFYVLNTVCKLMANKRLKFYDRTQFDNGVGVMRRPHSSIYGVRRSYLP